MDINININLLAALKVFDKIHNEYYHMLPLWTIAVRAYKIAQAIKKYQTLTTDQVLLLETSFNTTYYPNKTTLKQLVEQTGLTERKISNWFVQKRRQTRASGTKTTISIGEETYVYTCTYMHMHIHTCIHTNGYTLLIQTKSHVTIESYWYSIIFIPSQNPVT